MRDDVSPTDRRKSAFSHDDHLSRANSPPLPPITDLIRHEMTSWEALREGHCSTEAALLRVPGMRRWDTRLLCIPLGARPRT